MQEYQKRVVEEKNELTERTEKLAAFVGSENWRLLPEMDAWLLSEQLDVMRRYGRILTARIERFQSASTQAEGRC